MLYAIMHQNDSSESLNARLDYLRKEINILRDEAAAIEGILDGRGVDYFNSVMEEYYKSKTIPLPRTDEQIFKDSLCSK